MKYIMFTLLFLSMHISGSYASDDSLKPYAKIGVGYILDKPERIYINENKEKFSLQLYSNTNMQYSLETGFIANTDSNDKFRLGFSYINLFSQSGSEKATHNPGMLEVFGDYYWNYSGGWFCKIGTGYKLVYQDRINYKINGKREYIKYDKVPMIDRITARLEFGKQFENGISLSVAHHSQYFTGAPFNNEWEYHTTSIELSKTFK